MYHISVTRKSQLGYGNTDQLGKLADDWDKCKCPEESEKILSDIKQALSATTDKEALERIIAHFLLEHKVAASERLKVELAIKNARGTVLFFPNSAIPPEKKKTKKKKRR